MRAPSEVQREIERRLWQAVVALVGAIYLSAYFVQFAVDFLFKRNLLRLTLGAGFALAATVAAIWLARAGGRWRVGATMALVAAGYVGAGLALDVVQERVHLLEYGALVLLVRAALGARAAADPEFGFKSAAAVSCGAFALAFLAGAGDEAVQGLLPNRHADLRDLGLNAAAAAMALVAASAIEPALASDRRRSAAGR